MTNGRLNLLVKFVKIYPLICADNAPKVKGCTKLSCSSSFQVCRLGIRMLQVQGPLRNPSTLLGKIVVQRPTKNASSIPMRLMRLATTGPLSQR